MDQCTKKTSKFITKTFHNTFSTFFRKARNYDKKVSYKQLLSTNPTKSTLLWTSFNTSFAYYVKSSFLWFSYALLLTILLACGVCYVHKRLRSIALKQQREALHNALQRPTQPRRPGAEYRRHFILRNALIIARSFDNFGNTLNQINLLAHLRDIIKNIMSPRMLIRADSN